ncbi:hypothetical protein [Polaromonas sp.]|uniref:hypothetical protein n=1 Tax=Polaromonas sp. TaxID=1869339 RepID=UPI002D037215|nr:hypothetical protein [Polaromonas sp.]HQS91587.1 hypothetical protein [Polaromonas sp.]
MLKEVGASGQISLGKKYAGQLFDVVFYPDGRVEMVPMKVVPTVQGAAPDAPPSASPAHSVQQEAAAYRVGDGWLTPERLAARKAAYARTPEEIESARNQWEAENKDAIEAMNARMAKIGSMARRIHEWRKAKAGR